MPATVSFIRPKNSTDRILKNIRLCKGRKIRSKSEWNRKKSGKPVIIQLSIHIGDRELILGEMENAPQDQTYLVAYCNRTELWDRYEECLVSDDFIEVAEIYADRLKEQVRQVKDAYNKIPEDKYVYCMSEKDRDNFLKRIESETIKTINKGLGAAKKRRKERIDKLCK